MTRSLSKQGLSLKTKRMYEYNLVSTIFCISKSIGLQIIQQHFLKLSYLYHCAVQELHQLPDYLLLFLLHPIPWLLCRQKSVDLFHQGQLYYQKLVNLFLYLILHQILLKLNLQLHSHIRGHSEKLEKYKFSHA